MENCCSSSDNKNIESSLKFIQIFDPNSLLPVLEARLYRSAIIVNLVRVYYPKFKYLIKFYTLGQSISEDTWILGVVQSEQSGVEVVISTQVNPEITPEIQDAFKNTAPFDWTKSYQLIMLEQPLSHLFVKIIKDLTGNSFAFFSTYMYYMDEEGPRIQEERKIPEGIEIRPLEVNQGSKFIVDTWMFSRPGTLEQAARLIQHLPSCGIYINGQLVAGVLTRSYGIVGFLHTLKEHRNKGFGKLCMETLMKENQKNGLIFTSFVEVDNEPSKKLHESLGLIRSHEVDEILHVKRK